MKSGDVYMEIVKERTQDKVLLFFKGLCSFTDSQAISGIWNKIKSSNVKQLTIDFSELNYIDSSSLGILLLIKSESDKQDIKLVLKSPQGMVKKVFEVSKFSQIFSIEP